MFDHLSIFVWYTRNEQLSISFTVLKTTLHSFETRKEHTPTQRHICGFNTLTCRRPWCGWASGQASARFCKPDRKLNKDFLLICLDLLHVLLYRFDLSSAFIPCHGFVLRVSVQKSASFIFLICRWANKGMDIKEHAWWLNNLGPWVYSSNVRHGKGRGGGGKKEESGLGTTKTEFSHHFSYKLSHSQLCYVTTPPSPKRILSKTSKHSYRTTAQKASSHSEFFFYKHNVTCTIRANYKHAATSEDVYMFKTFPISFRPSEGLTFKGIQLLCQILLIPVLLILHEFLKRKQKTQINNVTMWCKQFPIIGLQNNFNMMSFSD